MRGLTEEERGYLERWSKGIYLEPLYEESPRGAPPSEGVSRGLFLRGLARWEAAGSYEERAVTTDMGLIALRVDAAARAAGVWA
jgi:hypothetical protein